VIVEGFAENVRVGALLPLDPTATATDFSTLPPLPVHLKV